MHSRSLEVASGYHKFTISEGAGLKCFDKAATRSSYDLSPGFSGDTKFRSVLYVEGPITDRNTSRFFSALSIPFARKKCSTRSTYSGQSSRLPSNSSTRPSVPDIPSRRQYMSCFCSLARARVHTAHGTTYTHTHSLHNAHS